MKHLRAGNLSSGQMKSANKWVLLNQRSHRGIIWNGSSIGVHKVMDVILGQTSQHGHSIWKELLLGKLQDLVFCGGLVQVYNKGATSKLVPHMGQAGILPNHLPTNGKLASGPGEPSTSGTWVIACHLEDEKATSYVHVLLQLWQLAIKVHLVKAVTCLLIRQQHFVNEDSQSLNS